MPVLSSGTFRVAPVNSVFGRSGVWSGGGVGHYLRTDADIIYAINLTNGGAVDNKRAWCGRLSTVPGEEDPPADSQPHRIGFGFDTGGSVVSLDGSAAGPIAGLPPGLLVATAKLRLKGEDLNQTEIVPLPTLPDDIYLQQDKILGTNEGLVDFDTPSETTYKEFVFTISTPTMFHLVDEGFGIRAVFNHANEAAYFYAADIIGTYVVVQWWWTIPAVDACGDEHDPQFQLSPDQPPDADDGGVYEKLDPEDYDAHPTPTIDRVTPDHGFAGDAVTIDGSGFGIGAAVTFDGVAATSVVVVTANRITCVAPVHAVGSTDVVVTNVDGEASA